MTDLRTRIKQAIDRAHASSKPHSTYDDWLTFAADAVIRELRLRQEWAVADSDGDHVYVGTVEENADKYTVQPGDHKETRYVTEWTADD